MAVDGLPFVSSDQLEGLGGGVLGVGDTGSEGEDYTRNTALMFVDDYPLHTQEGTRITSGLCSSREENSFEVKKHYLRPCLGEAGVAMDNGVRADRFVTTWHRVRKIRGDGDHGLELRVGGKRRVFTELF